MDVSIGTSLRSIYAQQVAQRGFSEDTAQLAAVEQLEELRRRLLESPPPPQSVFGRWVTRIGGRRRGGSADVRATRGVYLWGAVGRGKTWLMDLFFQSLPFPERRRRHFHRFMQEVHESLGSLEQHEAPLEIVAERIAAEVRVLCFDELYVTDIADAMLLSGLFKGLFRRGVVLVTTSNVPPRELYKDGLQRQQFLPAIELLERYTRVVAIEGGTDYRLRQLTQAGTYLAAGAADTASRLTQLFEQLADGSGVRGGELQIEGRPIAFERAADTVIWFGFEALCAGPRSQTDYLELARRYQTLIVAHVPVFDAAHDDQARRFIALIDVLYDRNVKLIVSAAAAPAELYRGERLSFEFQRASSRLIEMQSNEYLAREHRA